jgi:Tol biopolymer transport system component/predicted Ser/Thr protein kinase
MPLSAGDRLGPYEILAPIGAGGMGEVYKARDTRLDRTVAIKVSKEQFSQRFEQEARAIATLNHPHICTLYDVGPNYLVMEYIDGQPLKGPLPLDEALRLATQIADALDAAHRKGVTHRDLKPGNILVTKAGLKLLDFGLARFAHKAPVDGDTVTMAMTNPGTILGTFQYMAPEQLEAKEADARTDLFAFGAVLYEMVTGRKAFEGNSQANLITAVMTSQPPPIAPPALESVVKTCLAKDPEERWQTARDLKRALEWVANGPEPVKSTPSQSRLGMIAAAIAAVVAVMLGALAFVHFREAPPEQRSVRFQIPPPEKSSIQFFRLSPDGRFLAFTAADRRLWLRALDSLQAQPILGTDGALFPFWSPDSQFIGFFAQGKLKKIATAGGPPQIVCDATNAVGGTWNRDGVILFAPTFTSGLFRVPAAGGAPVQVTTKSISTGSHRYPEFLPDGRHFVYTVVFGGTEEIGIYVGSLDGKPPVRLLPDGSNVVYAPPGATGRSGALLFRRGDALMAQPFDLARFRMSGDVFPVAERVGVGVGGYVGLGAFSLSENGTLAYGVVGEPTIQLAWTDRTGKPMGSFGPPGPYNRFRLASDEKRIAFNYSNLDVGVLDSVRGVTSRLTFDPAADTIPMWSPDGLRVLWSSNRNGPFDLYIKSASGTGQEELLIKMDAGTGVGWGTDWSRDGRFILYQMPGAKTGQDLWIAPQFGDRKPFPYLQTQFDEQEGRFSPDGHWVAYISNESGRDEIYVQAFPPSGAKFQVSSGGGSEPQWRMDGTELFYLATDQMLMAVPVKPGRAGSESFQVDVPKPLMTVPAAGLAGVAVRSYAVSNDGQRFLIPSIAGGGTGPPITVVLNWQAGLKK